MSLYYEGRSINKSQNGIILLNYIQMMPTWWSCHLQYIIQYGSKTQYAINTDIHVLAKVQHQCTCYAVTQHM